MFAGENLSEEVRGVESVQIRMCAQLCSASLRCSSHSCGGKRFSCVRGRAPTSATRGESRETAVTRDTAARLGEFP